MSMPAKAIQPQTITPRADGRIVPIKAGGFGGSGSGKSMTFAMLAIGLSIHLHDRAPVYVFDTEPGWQFLRKLFELEGIKLIQETGETFDGLRKAHDKAISDGACVFAGDSYTHIWMNLMGEFMSRGGFVEFQDWNQIKPLWRNWTRDFLNSPMHCLALGRLGWNYVPEEEDRGGKTKIKMVKTDSKFNAGGGESFGYEPHLLIELDLIRSETKSGRGGKMSHRATILKDRSQVLNGCDFAFTELRGYKKGDYAQVWNAFAPHVQEMQRIESHVLIPAPGSTGLKQYDGSEYDRQRKEKESLLEEWYATMDLLYSARKTDESQLRLILTEAITGVRSKTRFEAFHVERLRECVELLRAFEDRCKSEKSIPANQAEVAAFLALAKNGDARTALESQLEASISDFVPDPADDLVTGGTQTNR